MSCHPEKVTCCWSGLALRPNSDNRSSKQGSRAADLTDRDGDQTRQAEYLMDLQFPLAEGVKSMSGTKWLI